VAADAQALAAALAPPLAHGAAPSAGELRQQPEDFCVEEELGFAPAGAGAHLLLKVQKRNANTLWVARRLARAAGCGAGAVGFAGLKDRRALAVQWFSVPRPRKEIDWSALGENDFTVLEWHAHHRKLPRGALAGNCFRVRVRTSGSGAEFAALLAPRLAAIERAGVPNYFGPQRFGRAGANLAPPRNAQVSREQRGFMLSAARSLLFNALLAARVREGDWNRLRAGDVAVLDGRGSIFSVEQPDESLVQRCAQLAIHPTGPLWGIGEPPSAAGVQALEIGVAGEWPAQRALCEAAGMPQERRSLRLRVAGLALEEEPQAVLLSFRLPRGGYATAVLRELVTAAAAAAPDL
jgi:tRNA pseudouridine13 synthase